MQKGLVWRAAFTAAAIAATVARAAQAAPLSSVEQLLARPGGLRADDVAARAVATSAELERTRKEVDAASADLARAFIAFAPRFSSTAKYTRLSSIGTPAIAGIDLAAPLDQMSVEQTLTIPLLDYVRRLPKSQQAARLARDAAITDDRSSRLQLRADARVAYYGWVRARLQRAVAEQSLEQGRQHLQSASRLFEVGSTSRADVLRVESQVASSELFLAKARASERVSEEQLRTIMHDDSGAPYDIGEDLVPGGARADADLSQAVAQAYSARLELRKLDQQAASARARSAATFAAGLPRMDAFASLTNGNPNSRYFPPRDAWETTWAAGVQFTWSPNDVADAFAASRAADLRATQVEDQQRSLKDSIRQEVTQAWESLEQSDTSLRSTERGLRAAEESHRVRRELFLQGRATSVELTDAETELTQARLDAVSARIDHRVARIQLDHATGRDVAQVNEGGRR
jgi:outer membrane protein